MSKVETQKLPTEAAYKFGLMSAIDLGCVKTPARNERAELLSQLSYPDGVGQRFCFSN
jgi:hypothetical protein